MPKLFYREKNTAPTPTPKATPPATPLSEEAGKRLEKALDDLILLGQDIKSHLASHDEKLSDHEARLRKLEGTESGDSSKDSSTGKSADKGTDKAPGGSSKDSSTGKPADKADGSLVTSYRMREVYFVHNDDGSIDWGNPFYSPNHACQFDPAYAIIPSLVDENGFYVRRLTLEEASRFSRRRA